MFSSQATRFSSLPGQLPRRFAAAMVLASFFLSGAVDAGAPDWTLRGFRPLTELPWKQPVQGDPPPRLEVEVLLKIFREPTHEIRFSVLATYLGLIDVGDLSRAFDHCIELEGTEMPDRLVSFFIEIWAKRDPQRCWECVDSLFQLVAIEDGWLSYDSWGNERIVVKNLDAVRASKFWLDRRSLLTFPKGIEGAEIPRGERTKYLRAFAEKWFTVFGSWPGAPEEVYCSYTKSRVAFVLAESPASIKQRANNTTFVHDASLYEAGVRRQLAADPSRALELVEEIRTKIWSGDDEETMKSNTFKVVEHEPSIEFLQLWAELNLPELLEWVESLPAERKETALAARGLVLSRVDVATRERWLADAKKHPLDANGTGEYASLLEEWAKWDLAPAFAAALATRNEWIPMGVAQSALSGEGFEPYNVKLARVRQIARLDLASQPKEIADGLSVNFFVFTMEYWGSIKMGEAARFGLDVLQKTGEVPRAELLRLFAGDNSVGGDGDVLDRTFCALRTWAVTRPDEMKAWLATMKDAEMRTALTWLLENPWGTGEVEE